MVTLLSSPQACGGHRLPVVSAPLRPHRRDSHSVPFPCSSPPLCLLLPTALGQRSVPRTCQTVSRIPVTVFPPHSLTGISPFVGENDKTTLMNIRNYNVAFEERMFQGLTREAKGFVIKVLVNDRL